MCDAGLDELKARPAQRAPPPEQAALRLAGLRTAARRRLLQVARTYSREALARYSREALALHVSTVRHVVVLAPQQALQAALVRARACGHTIHSSTAYI